MFTNNRVACKAGSWYPADKSELTDVLAAFMQKAHNTIDREALVSQPCTAVICPHAGLAFSGSCAAKSYYALAQKHPAPKTIILFGAAHSYTASSAGIWAEGEWESPLGSLKVDTKLATEALKLPYADEDYSSHISDNALELQLPFIKYLFPKSMILPIAVPPSPESQRLGHDLAILTRSAPNDYLVVGSSDLTHYGNNYSFCPAGSGTEGIEWARENDRILLRLITEMRTEMIINEVKKNHNACGSGAITATMAYAADRGVKSALTLQHILSYDIMPTENPDLSVGYASIIF